MEVEILKILYDYSMNNKIIDKEAIEKIVYFVVRERNLSRYISKLDFIDQSLDYTTPASYEFKEKVLTVFLNVFQSFYKSKFLTDFDNYKERLFYRNSQLIRIVLHELEHVYEYKYMHENDNFYANILLLSHELLINFPEKYSVTYNFNPSERGSNIYAQNTIRKVTSYSKKIFPKGYSFEEDTLLYLLSLGYSKNRIDEISCPLDIYIRKHDLPEAFGKKSYCTNGSNKKLKYIIDDYDLLSRLVIGLPISNEEFDNLSLDTVKKIRRI